MKLHEYQAKQLLSNFGVRVPKGEMVVSSDDALAVAARLGGRVVVKAQIHAGGRGKGGGVKVVADSDEAAQAAERILGMTLITPQTGPDGTTVRRLLVEEGLDIERELYLGCLIDRESKRETLIASASGGMSIEEVAKDTPELIHRETIDPAQGLMEFQARRLALALGLTGPEIRLAAEVMIFVWRAFREIDASLIEINPLVVTKQGAVIALDAKISLDENAMFRHTKLAELRDFEEEEELEIQASEFSLNYIRLDGNIGCMVNGAGLAMATMDIIKLAGGEPANFLDVGGGANAEQIENAFRILISDRNVKAVLINIFGGILRCDVLATGVVSAVRKLNVEVPVVIRMEGTNVKEGKEILDASGLSFFTADAMDDAAEHVVGLVKSV